MITQGCLAFRSHGSYWGIVRICKSVQNSAITFPDKDEMDFDNLATSFFCMLRNINPNIKKVEFGNQNFPHFWLRGWNLGFWLPTRATLQITAWVNKVTDEEHSRRLIGLNLVNLENLQNVATGKTGTVGWFLWGKVWNFKFCMVPNYAHWLTDFRTVFVFALGPFLPMFVIFLAIKSSRSVLQPSSYHCWATFL